MEYLPFYIQIGIALGIVNFCIGCLYLCLIVYTHLRDNKLSQKLEKYIPNEDCSGPLTIYFTIGSILYAVVWPLPIILFTIYLGYKYIILKILDKINSRMEKKDV